MSSTCLKPQGSSSGRWLYIEVWYSTFYMDQYKQTCWSTRLLPEDESLGLKHVEDIKIKILIYKSCSLLVYIV